MDTKTAFKHYVSLGYRPILLQHKSKKPLFRNWNGNYNKKKYLEILQSKSDYNIGLLLGDVIDVEGDNLIANNFLENLFKNIPHPTYKSLKSTHHIFRNYPSSKLTRFHSKGIEIRAYTHQSVVPPSVHQEGNFQYTWLHELKSIYEMPFFSIDLENKIKKFCDKTFNFVKKDHTKIWCIECKKLCFGHIKRIEKEIEVFKTEGKKWMCHSCRPEKITNKVRKLNFLDC
jgi:hypothetical protein